MFVASTYLFNMNILSESLHENGLSNHALEIWFCVVHEKAQLCKHIEEPWAAMVTPCLEQSFIRFPIMPTKQAMGRVVCQA